MVEYVEKQAVIMALETHWNGMVLDVFDFIRSLPSADVQQVILCKDCKSFSHGYCKFHDAKFVREDGYCYWGERKDGDTDG